MKRLYSLLILLLLVFSASVKAFEFNEGEINDTTIKISDTVNNKEKPLISARKLKNNKRIIMSSVLLLSVFTTLMVGLVYQVFKQNIKELSTSISN